MARTVSSPARGRRLAQLASIPVSELRGVGASKARALEKVEVRTVLDLLTHYPRRYLDRTREASVAELSPGDEAMVLGRVRFCRTQPTRSRRRMVVAEVSDGTGSLKVTFFNQPFREKQLPPGTEVVLFGRLEIFRGRRQMTNPVVDLVGDRTGRIVPVYPQSEKAGVMTWDLARMLDEVLERAGPFADPVPDEVLRHHGLVDRTTAFRDIHHPESMAAAQAARRRLVFDELLRVQLELVRRKRELEATARGFSHAVRAPAGGAPGLVERFHASLPFALTGAQRRAIAEIEADLASPQPMHRLLQGDVGAGKTLVAVSALLVAVAGGHQGALMAPTEVLAEQHAAGIRHLLADLTVPVAGGAGDLFSAASGARPLRVELLTNRTTAAERRRLLAGLADGSVDLAVGTHALIQDDIGFRSLGVVVIDEQHRFGVEQRAALRDRGGPAGPEGAEDAEGGRGAQPIPDVLVMTATPIPRTAAMTVYGDLDVSVLDELPPGRTPITTSWARVEPLTGEPEPGGPLAGEPPTGEPGAWEQVWERVRAEVADGRQAYVVCPLIEESDKLEAASAEETFAGLTGPDGELAGLRVGLLHGRVGPAEKERTMDLFRAGRLDVLVATTVIEVGVDVPNATVMVILDADRFGIAQLHQLRGRVGRGAARSYCYLVGRAATAEGEQRLAAMVRTTDGFELAEVDLDLRGEGTIMGERQKGRNDLKLASLRRDREWVARARDVAFEVVGDDPTLAGHPTLAEEVDLFLGDEESAAFLLKS